MDDGGKGVEELEGEALGLFGLLGHLLELGLLGGLGLLGLLVFLGLVDGRLVVGRRGLRDGGRRAGRAGG
ncbi:hypothetical protein FBR05_10980 [Deltaproteobacteria bacterium PRO3]|nr:hypothetical protein [Deltaproteobacteria bacterium PRO3]